MFTCRRSLFVGPGGSICQPQTHFAAVIICFIVYIISDAFPSGIGSIQAEENPTNLTTRLTGFLRLDIPQDLHFITQCRRIIVLHIYRNTAVGAHGIFSNQRLVILRSIRISNDSAAGNSGNTAYSFNADAF